MSETESVDDGVRFTYEDELVTAIDEKTGVASSGRSRSEALAMLADALALHERDDEPPSEDERDEILCSIGIDPDEIDTVPVEDRPEWLR